jgi:multicomponent Na+:H+ antiporter subunit D
MPFHHWLPGCDGRPDTCLRPAPCRGRCQGRRLLHHQGNALCFGVDTYGALNLGIPTAYFVGFTIIAASIIALSKDNLKARLAYSTVSQLSYIIMGVALLTALPESRAD